MSDMPLASFRSLRDKPGADAGALAVQVLTVVARRPNKAEWVMDPDFIDALCTVATSRSGDSFHAVVARMTAAGIRHEEIADHYVPAVARHLGDQWCADQTSFAEVTIGVARLQALLRKLGSEWQTGPWTWSDTAPNAPAVLVLSVADAFHTLGATVLSGQLRRIGLSVRQMLDVTPATAADEVQRIRYDAVFLSASRSEDLEYLRKIVTQIAGSTATPPPVVIGGTILEVADELGVDIKALTGADHATGDLYEAVALCGLDLKPRARMARIQGG
ncbi:MAG: cobalamin-dependent protein [Rubellimicrobium sp.]|nr:cobalamin-dependent protein [Rubellimicrobium sp.]